MRLLVLTVGFVGLCAPAVQARPTPSHAGVYDSVHIHKETGDLLGTWIRVADGPAPKVTFQFCEGDCPEEISAPATIVGERITFDRRGQRRRPDDARHRALYVKGTLAPGRAGGGQGIRAARQAAQRAALNFPLKRDIMRGSQLGSFQIKLSLLPAAPHHERSWRNW